MKPPQTLQSLKERLAGLGKRGGVAREDEAAGADGARALVEQGAAKAAELKARLRQRLEQLGKDGAGLGASLNARVEDLLRARPVEPPSEKTLAHESFERSTQRAAAPADPIIEVPEAAPLSAPPADPGARKRNADVDASPTRDSPTRDSPIRDSIVTRTFGRVGLTAVHARLGALARVRKKPEPAAIPKDAAGEPLIRRIDADMPLLEKATIAAVASPAPATIVEHQPSIAPPFVPEARSKTREATRRRRATGRSRMVSLVATLLTALVTGALVHVAVTLAMPTLSSWLGRGTAYDRLRFKLEPNAMKQLQVEATSSQPLLPFLTPDMQYAFCRYDISATSVAVTATLPDVGWSLALYTPQGDNFYAAPGVEGRATELSFFIVPSTDRLLILPGVRRADVDATQVTSPTREGLIVVRAPNKGRAFEAGTRSALAKANCQPVARR